MGGIAMRQRISDPPARLRKARLDNLTLVPGSMLPYIDRCQQMANDLPANAVLIVVPTNNAPQKHRLLAVAKLLSQEGHQVRVVSERELTPSSTHIQASLDL